MNVRQGQQFIDHDDEEDHSHNHARDLGEGRRQRNQRHNPPDDPEDEAENQADSVRYCRIDDRTARHFSEQFLLWRWKPPLSKQYLAPSLGWHWVAIVQSRIDRSAHFGI